MGTKRCIGVRTPLTAQRTSTVNAITRSPIYAVDDVVRQSTTSSRTNIDRSRFLLNKVSPPKTKGKVSEMATSKVCARMLGSTDTEESRGKRLVLSMYPVAESAVPVLNIMAG